MPAYNFKERFVPFVVDGSKFGTIRAFRRTPPRAGQMAYLYSGLRTRYVRKLAERPILVVHTVRITRDARGELVIDVWPNWSCESEREFFAVAEGLPHHQFKEGKVDAIAFMDGFRHENAPEQIIGCGSLMRNFWGPEMFIGHWILWSHVALKTEL